MQSGVGCKIWQRKHHTFSSVLNTPKLTSKYTYFGFLTVLWYSNSVRCQLSFTLTHPLTKTHRTHYPKFPTEPKKKSRIPTVTKKLLVTARETQLKKKKKMLETVKYLIGSAGASGYGSKSTAEQITESCGDLSSITAIITGNQSWPFNQKPVYMSMCGS